MLIIKKIWQTSLKNSNKYHNYMQLYPKINFQGSLSTFCTSSDELKIKLNDFTNKLTLNTKNYDLLNRKKTFVDKTHLIEQLLYYSQNVSSDLFIQRPRRIGKSSMIRLIKWILEGKKDLFKETAIGQSKNYKWDEWGVIFIDFSSLTTTSSQEFKQCINEELQIIEKNYNFKILNEAKTSTNNLKTLIEELKKKYGKVAILIDEYEKPITDYYFTKNQLAKDNLEVINNFYSTIKGIQNVDFMLITGITKFSKVNLFSGANQIEDISLNPQFSEIVGFTLDEVKHYYSNHINTLDQYLKNIENQRKDIYSEILRNYNGYRFTKDNSATIINPISFMHYLKSMGEIKNYWSLTGNTKIMEDYFFAYYKKNEKFPIVKNPETIEADNFLQKYDFDSYSQKSLLELMFQTGYVTIKNYSNNSYELEIPNEEISQTINNIKNDTILKHDNIEKENVKQFLQKLEIDQFIQLFERIFYSFSYSSFPDSKKESENKSEEESQKKEKLYESHFSSILQVFLKCNDIQYFAESQTNQGRSDVVIDLSRYSIVYILELKVDQTPQIAINQILKQEYHKKFLHSQNELIVLVGLNFYRNERKLESHKVEILNKEGEVISIENAKEILENKNK